METIVGLVSKTIGSIEQMLSQKLTKVHDKVGDELAVDKMHHFIFAKAQKYLLCFDHTMKWYEQWSANDVLVKTINVIMKHSLQRAMTDNTKLVITIKGLCF